MTTTVPDTLLLDHDRATGSGPEPWTADELERRLRELVVSRYHDRHPFNRRMHEGRLTPGELRTWVANRFYYQCNIPIKDALVLSKLLLPAQRRSWLRRIQDHDGHTDQDGGIERWLRLGEAVGLRRDELLDHRHLLPGVRLAVDGYVNFCRNASALEAVASSLTELCAPSIMLTRLETFPAHYPWIESAGLSYFRGRVPQGRRDGSEALGWVRAWAVTGEQQEQALAAVSFKCDVLWSLLDSVQGAGGEGRRDA
ncbi:pyrroloquinoline-quinone synthase PqqC [Streptomyces fuscichromogenes]|uniref:Pyrroloquinoline-quinone synthase n=1 Tax=Streptomyces fuscichromogenes TaxID=1324013 RepID=A0A917UI14_9ACTN|nr:pyrroloquinoline-quinone synthase PqqC [Streptomyces fuscichromogenes]GGM96801.1 pyrroloquinoline-quinone synthase [Streptomyces fuscichromogenes]